jgi:hypothetical protein
LEVLEELQQTFALVELLEQLTEELEVAAHISQLEIH